MTVTVSRKLFEILILCLRSVVHLAVACIPIYDYAQCSLYYSEYIIITYTRVHCISSFLKKIYFLKAPIGIFLCTRNACEYYNILKPSHVMFDDRVENYSGSFKVLTKNMRINNVVFVLSSPRHFCYKIIKIFSNFQK